MRDTVLWRRLLAEFLGSAFLAAIVIGSGIAAQNLSPGNIGLELFENAATTATGLFAIILMFGPISGGHFNPVVSFVDAGFGGLKWKDAAAYLPFQVVGCVCGAILANVMFSEAAISISTKHRASGPHWLSEVVATIGLILVIFALARSGRSHLAPAAVGAYIGAAYFFTSSTSFANPAITVGRMFSNTFAGIAPSSVPNFISAQIVGGVLAFGLIKGLYPGITKAEAADVIEPHLRGENDLETRSDFLHPRKGQPMHLVTIGGSDAGISAALRARELDPTTGVTVIVADANPNFSIGGIPYHVSGEVIHWRNLAHRTLGGRKATGMLVRLNTRATKIDVAGRRLHIVDEAGVEDHFA